MAFLSVFWYEFKTFILKKYSESKQTKYSGFIKLGVLWPERDIYEGLNFCNWNNENCTFRVCHIH